MIAFGDLVPGLEVPPLARIVTRDDVRAYAEAGGDRNALHLDDDAARAAGFDGVIAHGMFTMGHLAACLESWLGDLTPLARLVAQFRSPVRMGDTIVAGGRVRAVDHRARTASIDLWVRVERDGATEHPIKRGSAELRFAGGR